MRRAAILAMSLALPTAAAADTPSDCAARLDRTLQIMEQRAPMKDEVATGLMWLRMDAAAALEAGDAATCRAKVAAVERVLNIASDGS